MKKNNDKHTLESGIPSSLNETEKRLQKENEDLKNKLAEAEDALNAIRSGEVDAIVVGDKIFSITSSETPYRHIIEQMEEGAVTLNSDGVILYSNPRFCAMTGLPSEKVTGNYLKAFIEAEDVSKFKEILKKGNKGRSTGQFRLISTTGTEFCLFTVNSLPQGVIGELCVIISSITDIKNFEKQLFDLVKQRTNELEKSNQKLEKDIISRKETERKLIHSEHIINYFLDSVPVGVIRWAKAGPIRSANDQFLKMIGYSREDLEKGEILWTKLTLPEYAERDTLAFEEFFTTGKCYPYEKAYYRKDGSILPILISSVLVDRETEEGIGFVLDLSEIKQKEELLRHNQTILQDTQKLARTGSWEFDLKKKTIFWSENTYRIFGKDPETFTPTLDALFSLVHPEDKKNVQQTIENYINNPGFYETKYRILVNRKTIHIHTIAQVLNDRQGNPELLIGSTQDITESVIREKQLEESEKRARKLFEELHDSEKKFRELVKYAPTAIYEVDFIRKKFVTVNDAMILLTGYSRDELLQMNPWEILEEESQRTFSERINLAMSGGSPKTIVEYKVRTKDGRRLEALLNVSFRYNEHGIITGALVVGHDMTDRIRAARELYAALKEVEFERNRLETFFKISPLGIVIVEKSTGRFSFANEMAEQYYGVSDLTGQGVGEHLKKIKILTVNEEEVPNALLPSSRTFATGEKITGEEYIIKRPDGSMINILSSTAPLYNNKGEVEAIIGIFQDITASKIDKKQLEYQSHLISNISDAVIASDRDMRITYWNKGAERSYGYTREEAIGKMGPVLLDSKFVNYKREEAIRLGTELGQFEAEVIQKHKDGRLIHFQSVFSVLKDDLGNVTDYISVNRDLTERNKFMKDLKESEERFHQMFKRHQVVELIIQANTGRIIDANDAAVKFYGYPHEKICSMYIHEINKGTTQQVNDALQYANDEKNNKFEFTHQLANGDIRWVEVYSTPVETGQGKVLYSIIHDITESKKAEEKIHTILQRLYRILSNMNNGILLITDENKVEFANQAFCDIFSLKESPEDLLNMSSEEMLKKVRDVYVDPEFSLNRINNIVSEGKRIQNEDVTLKNSRTVIRTFVPIILDGKLNSRLWSHVDITERKKTEEALRAANNTLEAINLILEHALQSLSQKELAKKCLSITQTLTGSEIGFIAEIRDNKLFQITNSYENQDSSNSEIFSGQNQYVEIKGIFQKIVTSGKPFFTNDPDDLFVTSGIPEGHPSITNIIGVPLFYETNVTGILVMANNKKGYSIAEQETLESVAPVIVEAFLRKQTQEAFRKSEERYSTIFWNSPDGISLTKLPENKIFMVNAAFEKVFGFGKGEIRGKTSVEMNIAETEDQKLVTELYKKDGFVKDYECVRRDKYGNNLNLILSLTPVNVGEDDFILTTIIDITDRRRIEEAMREREKENALLANIIEVSSQSIVFGSLEGKILYTNLAFQTLLGYSNDELIGESWNQLLTAPEYRDIELRFRVELLVTGIPVRYEKEYIRKDRTRVPVELVLNTKKDKDGKPQFYFAFINDITERKKNEANLHKMIRTLRAMQRSSQLMIHARDEHKFLEDVCRVIVEDCGFSMVWIGYKQNDEKKSILPVAWAGFDEGYIDSLDLTWDETERGRGPSGTTVRTGKISMCRDMATDPAFEPWRAEATRRGYRSSIVFPLFMDENVFGVISIYSPEPDTFTEDEQVLLMRMADDLAYGIYSIRLNLALKQSKQDLEYKVEERTSLLQKTLDELDNERQRFQDVLNMIPAYVVLFTPDQKIRFANKIFKETFGEISDRICGQHPQKKGQGCDICDIEQVLLMSKPKHWEWEAQNGRIYQVSDFPFIDNDNTNLILEMGIDITEKRNVQQFVLSKILETEERDRRRFASDLHDDLGPTMSAIKLQLSLLASDNSPDDKDEILDVCDLLLSEGIEKMRTLANNIMPSLIESYGLGTAVKSFINRMEKGGQLTFKLKSNLEGTRFDGETELHFYRIITELVNNTIKHSGATEVNLDMILNGKALRITYSDNGIGYDVTKGEESSFGIGLQNIRNRIKLVEASIDFINRGGKTIVVINKLFNEQLEKA